ncbi:unnamed protein product [Owenia fusiformis]|uniref:5'-nucleotidase n=1 Tax=Owenia fusiformis TaxID=6347 RepID=A0A8J1UF54_OWEFU|nr:unnamed protein product [Owenia fusiformis]
MEALLTKQGVYMRDPAYVEQLVKEIVSAGKDKLQVIADFDMTLSRFSINGKRCPTCHSVLDDSSELPESYKTTAHGLRAKYYPIEISTEKTTEEKIPYMVDWWTQAHDLLVTCNLTKSKLRDIVRDSEIVLRDGCNWFLDELHKHKLPLLIFSAGVGDIIIEVLLHQHEMYENIKIVSNFMNFNNQGVLTGFKGELIHTYNKNKSAIHKSDYFEKLAKRENVILLGDSVGDLRMADGCKYSKNVLKIGFLNDKVEERMDTYKNLYDIVLVADETMDVPNSILREVFRM